MDLKLLPDGYSKSPQFVAYYQIFPANRWLAFDAQVL